MELIDLHSHWGTERGYTLRGPEELARQEAVWRTKPSYVTEEEMAGHFRKVGVKVILDLGHFVKLLPVEQARQLHDYAFSMQREHPDVVLGNWIHIDPRTGLEGLNELRRCIDVSTGFLGFAVSGSGTVPANDPHFDPFYKLCIEAGIPALILVGYTGLGATLPGGGGMLLDDCHPRYVDEVAAKYPKLTIVAGRPAWPWQTEMIAVLLHKSNVWYELHGWSPRYFTADLKYEISRRLKDRVMFGADYPLVPYERLLSEWQTEGYAEDILERVFHKNANRLFSELRERRGYATA